MKGADITMSRLDETRVGWELKQWSLDGCKMDYGYFKRYFDQNNTIAEDLAVMLTRDDGRKIVMQLIGEIALNNKIIAISKF